MTLCFILDAVYVFLCAYTHHDKDSIHHFWTAITVPLRKLSRWVWNMQQFVWSLRCLFRTAFACNYNKLGSMPCYWCIPFVLRSNFLFLREKESALWFFFFFYCSTHVHDYSPVVHWNLFKPGRGASRLQLLQKKYSELFRSIKSKLILWWVNCLLGKAIFQITTIIRWYGCCL